MKLLLITLLLSLVLLTACASSTEPRPFPPPEGYSSWEEYHEELDRKSTPLPIPTPAPTPTVASITFTLSISVSPIGAGSISPSSGSYEPEARVTLTATASAGYQFSSWSGDASGTGPTITIIMDSNKNIIANFIRQHVWVAPVDATASGYTIWGGTWYTGPPSLAIDGNKITAWTLNAMGEITFDLGSERVVEAIEAYWGGHVTNGNTVNVYVDGKQVLTNERFGATSNIRYFTPLRGRFVKYQTVALPHNEYLQIATWSEIAEFKVLVESEDFTFVTPKPPTEVGGIISSNTIWTVQNSPYVITSTVQIPIGVTLTIEPGVVISKPTSGNMFLLLGKIYAHGTAQAQIIFDGGGNSTIIGTDPGKGIGDFEYCIFKNGYSLWDRWGQINLRYSQLINLTTGSNKAIGGACIQLDGPSGECNIEYNKFINTGGILSYASDYGFNIRYNLFQKMCSPICNAGGGTPQTPNKMVVKFNSFIGIEGIVLSLEPVFSPIIDATDNYWDTIDTAAIDAKIYDGNDDVRIGSRITYLPILTSPHPSTPSPD